MALEGSTRPKTTERPMELSLVEKAGENMLERFHQDLQDMGLDIELFENRMGKMLRDLSPRWLPAFWGAETLSALDLEETPTSYVVHMNLPGIVKDQVTVRFLDQSLEIDAEAKKAKEIERKNYVQRERQEAKYHRLLSFPTPVVPDKAEAKLEHGVLNVNVPKQKPAKELKISVV
jgi:HSP20 family protein